MSRLPLVALFFLLTVAAHADNWPRWRGPSFNGVAEGTGYPTRWSSRENALWKVPLPGGSGSTPAVWENRVFVTCPSGERNLVICFDLDGQELWQTDLGAGKPGKHRKGSGSNPSPTTDGEFVFAYYKSGDLACLDFDGEAVWQQNLQEMFGEDTLWWDLGSSPVLVDDLVVVACVQSGPSYLVAFDKRTGEIAWKHDRNLPAPEEANQTYSTPLVVTHEGEKRLIVLGADHVTAHDTSSGEEIWRVGGMNPEQDHYFRSIASPVAADGLIIAPYARGQTLTAIRMGGRGDVTDSHVVWIKEGHSADVPTPAAVDGRVYVCTDKGAIGCFEAATGRLIWSEQLERHRMAYSSSPVIADGKLYVTREDGTTFVLKLGDAPEILAKNELGETTLATPVFVDGRVIIKTFDSLYCLAE